MAPSKDRHLADFAKAVQLACRRAAADAYEDALVRGLCAEGAFEAAMGAIDTLDSQSLIDRLNPKPAKRSGIPITKRPRTNNDCLPHK